MNKRLHEIQQELATLVQADPKPEILIIVDFEHELATAKQDAEIAFIANDKDRAKRVESAKGLIATREGKIDKLKLEARELVNGEVRSKTDNDDLPDGLTVKHSVKANVYNEIGLIQELAKRMPWLLKIDMKALDAFVKTHATEDNDGDITLPEVILDAFGYSLHARYEATLNISDKELAKAGTNVETPDDDAIPF